MGKRSLYLGRRRMHHRATEEDEVGRGRIASSYLILLCGSVVHLSF
jgi:hypothetical protein